MKKMVTVCLKQPQEASKIKALNFIVTSQSMNYVTAATQSPNESLIAIDHTSKVGLLVL